MNGDITWFK